MKRKNTQSQMIVKVCDYLLEIISVDIDKDNKHIVLKTVPIEDLPIDNIAKAICDEQQNIFERNSKQNDNSNQEHKLFYAVEKFINVRKTQFPNFMSVRNADIFQAMKEVNKLISKGYSEETIIDCLEIALYDSFWDRNLMVLTSLNKKCSDGLTKFEHLLNILEKKKKTDTKNKVIEKESPTGFAYEEL